MTLKTLFTSVIIASTFVLSACSNTPVENDAPNATAEVSINVQEVASDSADKPAFSASRTIVVTSTVIAIDHDTRLVTLKNEAGQPVSFTAAKDIRNLDQLAVGDAVTAEYLQNFSLRVLATKNPEAAEAELAVVERTEEGDMPGMAIVDTKVEVLTVEDINLEENTFILRHVDGSFREYKAHNPENLKKAAVGDVVVVTYTEGLAISVQEKAPK